jgi:hypothetical protein
VTSVAYLYNDIITNDVMTRYDSTLVLYVYKGPREDAVSPQFPLPVRYRLVLRSTITVVGFPPHCPSELPLQAERATPYLRAIVSSKDL